MITEEQFRLIAAAHFKNPRVSIEKKVDMYEETPFNEVINSKAYRFTSFVKEFGDNVICYGNILLSGSTSEGMLVPSMAKACLLKDGKRYLSKQLNTPLITKVTADGGLTEAAGMTDVYLKASEGLNTNLYPINPYIYRTGNMVDTLVPFNVNEITDNLELRGVLFNSLITVRAFGTSRSVAPGGVILDYYIASLY